MQVGREDLVKSEIAVNLKGIILIQNWKFQIKDQTIGDLATMSLKVGSPTLCEGTPWTGFPSETHDSWFNITTHTSSPAPAGVFLRLQARCKLSGSLAKKEQSGKKNSRRKKLYGKISRWRFFRFESTPCCSLSLQITSKNGSVADQFQYVNFNIIHLSIV